MFLWPTVVCRRKIFQEIDPWMISIIIILPIKTNLFKHILKLLIYLRLYLLEKYAKVGGRMSQSFKFNKGKHYDETLWKIKQGRWVGSNFRENVFPNHFSNTVFKLHPVKKFLLSLSLSAAITITQLEKLAWLYCTE